MRDANTGPDSGVRECGAPGRLQPRYARARKILSSNTHQILWFCTKKTPNSATQRNRRGAVVPRRERRHDEWRRDSGGATAAARRAAARRAAVRRAAARRAATLRKIPYDSIYPDQIMRDRVIARSAIARPPISDLRSPICMSSSNRDSSHRRGDRRSEIARRSSDRPIARSESIAIGRSITTDTDLPARA